MRDWVLIVTPVVIVAYFLVYPDQFNAFVAWAQSIIR